MLEGHHMEPVYLLFPVCVFDDFAFGDLEIHHLKLEKLRDQEIAHDEHESVDFAHELEVDLHYYELESAWLEFVGPKRMLASGQLVLKKLERDPESEQLEDDPELEELASDQESGQYKQ